MSAHSQRVVARQAINGQPNGYRPITEQELQALHCANEQGGVGFHGEVHGIVKAA